MSYQALYRAWRPGTFSEICDQDAVVRTLRRQVETGRIAHAYIFEGDACVDKEGLARNFAKAILCRQKPGEGCGHCIICQKLDHGNYGDFFQIESNGFSRTF